MSRDKHTIIYKVQLGKMKFEYRNFIMVLLKILPALANDRVVGLIQVNKEVEYK